MRSCRKKCFLSDAYFYGEKDGNREKSKGNKLKNNHKTIKIDFVLFFAVNRRAPHTLAMILKKKQKNKTHFVFHKQPHEAFIKTIQ